jgi:hypothetical protein
MKALRGGSTFSMVGGDFGGSTATSAPSVDATSEETRTDVTVGPPPHEATARLRRVAEIRTGAAYSFAITA